MKGLGGWLVLVAIGLFGVVVFQSYGAYETARTFADGTVEFLSNPASEVYVPGFSAVVRFELIASLLLMSAGVYLMALFFRKSRKFPEYYLPFLVVLVAYAVVDYVLAATLSISHEEMREAVEKELSSTATEIGRATMYVLIWGSYIRKSRRVKATFIAE